MTGKPIRDKVKGIRQRRRSDGSWRVWWEPNADERALGFDALELDPERHAWSVREAKNRNDAVLKTSKAGGDHARRSSHGRTIDGVIADYRASRFFADDLQPHTMVGYTTCMNAISRKWGAQNVAQFTKPIMQQWYETLVKTSGRDYARLMTSMMSILFSHAEQLGWRPENSNPCFRLKRYAITTRKRHASWAEFDALLAAADYMNMPGVAAAIALATLCPPRASDVLAAEVAYFEETLVEVAPGQHITMLVWSKTLSKKGNRNAAPIHPMIEPRIRALLDKATPGQTRLITDNSGRPLSYKRLNTCWRTLRTRIADGPSADETAKGTRQIPEILRTAMPDIADLQFRDLRRTFGVWARMSGASKDDVADVLGNSAGTDPLLAETYMPASLHTAARAVMAVQRPAAESEKKKA